MSPTIVITLIDLMVQSAIGKSNWEWSIREDELAFSICTYASGWDGIIRTAGWLWFDRHTSTEHIYGHSHNQADGDPNRVTDLMGSDPEVDEHRSGTQFGWKVKILISLYLLYQTETDLVCKRTKWHVRICKCTQIPKEHTYKIIVL